MSKIEEQKPMYTLWQVSIAGDVYGKDQRRRYYQFSTLTKAQKFIHYWIVDYIEITGHGPYDTINLGLRNFEKLPKKIDDFNTGRK